MTSDTKIDLSKECKEEYVQPKKPVLIQTKPALYMTIEGRGAPGGSVFEERIGALYGIAYTVKMTRKFAGQQDYVVGKLEGIWDSEDGREQFIKLPKDQWIWKLIIRTPDFVKKEELERAVTLLRKRGKTEPVELVRLETLSEGTCVQMLHVGPYDQEEKTVALMRNFAEINGYKLCGKHHEIYISDPRRVDPAKLKTILRHPVIPAQEKK